MFHWQQVRSIQTYFTQWHNLYQVQNPQVCSGIGSRSRIGSIIYQLQRSQNYATNFTGNGPPTTGYSYIVITWRQREFQMTQSRNNVPDQWKWVFLGHRSSKKRRHGNTMASRPRKPCWLYKQTPWYQAPSISATMVHTRRQLSARTTTHKKANCSVRVCCNCIQWIQQNVSTPQNSSVTKTCG